jgi:hypothetical protein
VWWPVVIIISSVLARYDSDIIAVIVTMAVGYLTLSPTLLFF